MLVSKAMDFIHDRSNKFVVVVMDGMLAGQLLTDYWGDAQEFLFQRQGLEILSFSREPMIRQEQVMWES